MTIRLRSWQKCQAPVLRKITSQRKRRVEAGESDGDLLRKAISLSHVTIDSTLDHHFHQFAELVGGGRAEAYFVRVLQYVALGHALTGEIPVSRGKFGTLVLSRQWDIVSRRVGEKVYDALLESNIAVNGRDE